MLNFICQVSSHQLGYRIKVGLQKGGIAFGFDAAVEDAIISKVPTLQQRRQHSKIMLYCRIRHQLANIPTATYIRPSTRNTQHYILPHTCISNIFLPQHHQHMEQPTTCHNQLAQPFHNLEKHCNPNQHQVGVGQHVQLRLRGHLTLTSITTITYQHINIR